ncbi:MAG: hypothetical protein M3Q83_05520 [Pseudomonadota bacterium]|nr:hypothetical protein [Pseudomonadota bacterium]
MLWLAALIATVPNSALVSLAQNPADRAVVTTIAAIRDNPLAFHGVRVRLRGWVYSCKSLSCSLYMYGPSIPRRHHHSLSIEGNREFDLQVAGQAPVEIVIHATVNASCLRGHEICLDRADELTRIALERVLPAQSKTTTKEQR